MRRLPAGVRRAAVPPETKGWGEVSRSSAGRIDDVRTPARTSHVTRLQRVERDPGLSTPKRVTRHLSCRWNELHDSFPAAETKGHSRRPVNTRPPSPVVWAFGVSFTGVVRSPRTTDCGGRDTPTRKRYTPMSSTVPAQSRVGVTDSARDSSSRTVGPSTSRAFRVNCTVQQDFTSVSCQLNRSNNVRTLNCSDDRAYAHETILYWTQRGVSCRTE